MNVGHISPNFKGLMRFDAERLAINTDQITHIDESIKTPKNPHTLIYLTNGDYIKVPYSYTEIIEAYKKATRAPEDIDEGRGVLQIKRGIKYIRHELIETPTKTNSGKRVIVLAETLRKQLIERHKHISSEWVFPDFEDVEFPIMPNKATEVLKKIMFQAGLPYIPFHNLRHTFATQALASGIEPETISNILGHKYVSFTLDTYMHSTVDMQKNVSAYIRDLILEYGDNNGR